MESVPTRIWVAIVSCTRAMDAATVITSARTTVAAILPSAVSVPGRR
jgi:hypothetical protein